MGQARQRKLTDPSYGIVSSKMRGLVISCPVAVSGSTISITSSDLDPQDLRSSLLYWDRLAWPTNNIIHFGSGPDAAFLESSGILYRPKQSLSGDAAAGLVVAQAKTLADLETREPGVWCLGGGENSLLIKAGLAVSGQGTLMQLYNAIPVPAKDVPLSEILEFKQRRRPELLMFRAHFEAMTKEIESSADSEDELNKKLNEIDQACSNLVRVTREWNFPIYLSNLKASFNFDLTKAATSAVKVWTAAEKLNLDMTTKGISAGVAGLSSMISITSDIKLQSIRRPASPFKYAYQIQKELN